MKRIISLLTAIMLLVSVSCSIHAVAAEDEPTFEVSTVRADPGQDVSVAIRIVNNPGIASIKLKASFDSGLTLKKITYNSGLGGKSQQPETFTSPVTMNWFNGKENTVGDMDYAVLTFTVAQNASIGLHPVTITYDADDIYNIAEQNVPFVIENGGVNVSVSLKGLTLDRTSATVETDDETVTLTPIFTPSNATNKNVRWISDNESIATVKNGVVTLLDNGEVEIYAISEDGGYIATCSLTVLCSHMGIYFPPVESTCIKHGHAGYTICVECNEILSGSADPLPLADHTYIDPPVWTWHGYESAQATFTCSVCEDEQTYDAAITSKISKKPTLSAEGERAYRARVVYGGTTYSDTKYETVRRLYLLGDTDHDEEINIVDATFIQRYLVDMRLPFEFVDIPADVDGDDEVSIVDSTWIQRWLAEMEIPYAVGEII